MAAVPLKLTTPAVPRLVPVIVTLLPARPLTGESVLSTGAAGAGVVTVKVRPLEAAAPVGVTVDGLGAGAEAGGDRGDDAASAVQEVAVAASAAEAHRRRRCRGWCR